MVVTSVEFKKGSTGRCCVYVDCKFFCDASFDILKELGIDTGSHVNQELLDRLSLLENISLARKKALLYLDYSERSKKAMIERLRRADFSEEEASAAVSSLEEEGVIDDHGYSVRLANYLYKKKRFGKRRVISELISKGIDRDTASQAAELEYPEDIGPSLTALIEKRLRGKTDPSKGEIEKLVAHLIRYGHEYSDIKEALDNYTD